MDFYNSNSFRAYPFVLGTAAALPEDAVVDAGFVAGPASEFASAEHSVTLARVVRQGGLLRFEFTSDAPGLFQATLAFTRDPGSSGPFESEFSDGGFGEEAEVSASVEGLCEEPPWRGFLVTGDLAALAALLPDEDDELLPAAVVEPALVQNLAGGLVTGFSVANLDRNRAESPDGCPEIAWPVEVGGVFVWARCLTGEVRFREGYNAVVRQEPGGLVFGARVGAGAGQPCNEVPLFPGEEPPGDGVLLDGSPACNEVLRSVNGLPGPVLRFTASAGAEIVEDPDANRLTVDVSLNGLSLCGSTFVSEVV